MIVVDSSSRHALPSPEPPPEVIRRCETKEGYRRRSFLSSIDIGLRGSEETWLNTFRSGAGLVTGRPWMHAAVHSTRLRDNVRRRLLRRKIAASGCRPEEPVSSQPFPDGRTHEIGKSNRKLLAQRRQMRARRNRLPHPVSLSLQRFGTEDGSRWIGSWFVTPPSVCVATSTCSGEFCVTRVAGREVRTTWIIN